MQNKVDFFQRQIIRIFVLNVRWPNIAKNEGKRTMVHNYLKKALKMVWQNSPNGSIYFQVTLLYSMLYKNSDDPEEDYREHG